MEANKLGYTPEWMHVNKKEILGAWRTRQRSRRMRTGKDFAFPTDGEIKQFLWKARIKKMLPARAQVIIGAAEQRRRHYALKRNAPIGSLKAIVKVYAQCRWWKKWFNVEVDHIIPLARGGSHSAENLQIIFTSENRRKRASLAYKHGHNTSDGQNPSYLSCANMIQRTTNPRATGYERYGGNGITVDPSWRASFVVFLQDMGEKPGPDFQIHRLDNDGPYCKKNCVWIERSEHVRLHSNQRRQIERRAA
jgi:HNH endonuclease.